MSIFCHCLMHNLDTSLMLVSVCKLVAETVSDPNWCHSFTPAASSLHWSRGWPQAWRRWRRLGPAAAPNAAAWRTRPAACQTHSRRSKARRFGSLWENWQMCLVAGRAAAVSVFRFNSSNLPWQLLSLQICCFLSHNIHTHSVFYVITVNMWGHFHWNNCRWDRRAIIFACNRANCEEYQKFDISGAPTVNISIPEVLPFKLLLAALRADTLIQTVCSPRVAV